MDALVKAYAAQTEETSETAEDLRSAVRDLRAEVTRLASELGSRPTAKRRGKN